jgi:hypothetical protein
VRGLGAADFRVGEVWAEGAGRRGGGATVVGVLLAGRSRESRRPRCARLVWRRRARGGMRALQRLRSRNAMLERLGGSPPEGR